MVRWTSDRIELVSATPNDGFRVSIEDAGPEQVVVEFEGDEEGSKFVAKVGNGEISVKTEIED